MIQDGLPPGPGWSRAVQTVGWHTRTVPFLLRCRQRYGDMFTLRIAQEGTWVLLADPEHVKQVFTGDPRIFHAGEANEILLPLLGESSVLLLDEERHMRQRKLMLPPFHGERMERYGELMSEVAEREVAGWPAREPLRLWPRMQAVTLEVIMRAVFGVEEGARLDELRQVLRDLLGKATDPRSMLMIAVLGPRRFARLPMVRRDLRPADTLIYEEIERRRRAPDLEEREDVLSLLLQARYEDGSPMSDRELRDELMTLLVAGHETTATALSWSVERLIRHPDKLDRARSGDEDYLDAVVKETLRLRPVIPIVVRQLTEPVEMGGWRLPPGARVSPCIVLLHRRQDVYPEPHSFRPERFLGVKPGTYTWIPFGGGVRRCLGASFAMYEMKRVLPAVLRRLERPVEAARERIVRRAITLTPSRGAEVVAA